MSEADKETIKFDTSRLFIELRKQEEKLRPKTGELYQGVFYALLSAKENFESANILFKEKKNTQAFVLCIAAVEEIGKINKLANAIPEWKTDENLKEFLSEQKNHTWKITKALELAQYLLKKDSLTVKLKSGEKESDVDLFEMVAKALDPAIAKQYHQMRLAIGYSNFQSNLAISPYHTLDEAYIDLLQVGAEFSAKLIGLLLNIHEKIMPKLHALVVETYYLKNRQKIKEAKEEINRQIRRIMPALRKHMIEEDMKATGIIGDAWWIKYNSDMTDVSRLKNIKFNFEYVSELISSHNLIEEIYFYPPLKEEAVSHYLMKNKKPSLFLLKSKLKRAVLPRIHKLINWMRSW